MVAFLERGGLDGLTVLEIGGGVGEIALELLKRGARGAVNLELSPAYDAEAEQLVLEAGLEGRAVRRLHDLAVDPDGAEPADIVVLHRVVCCYPDYVRLLTAAAQHARRMLVFSHPPRNLAVARAGRGEQPRVPAARQRVPHVRPPAGRDGRGARVARAAPTFAHDGPVWHVVGPRTRVAATQPGPARE